jgi:enterochelin esterase family protein
MKRPSILPFVTLICLAIFVVQASAQRRPPVRSPEVHDDGKVTFRLSAPNAESVRVAGQWPQGEAAMKKDDSGVWSVTLGPLPKGVWEYSLRVDGISMIDPGNSWIKPMRSPRTSILHLPSDPPAVYDFQDVPHGTVHFHTYRSKALGRLRELAVYTPPGYDQSADRRYPVLFLQHGSGDNHATWTVHGKAHWILDNLIAKEDAVPMVVVMMDGHAALPGEGRGANTRRFEQDLLQDVIPFIEESYRVNRDAKQRGIVGLSMGGGQSLTIGLTHTDKFAWVGGFSSSVPRADVVSNALDDPKGTNDRLQLLWIACGKDDFLLDRNEQFISQLEEAGMEHTWMLTDGNHSWPIWRDYLAQFVPRLFQGDASP